MSITKPVPSVSNEKLQWIFNFSYYYKILDLLTHSNLLLNCINQHDTDTILLFTILFYYSFFIFPLFFNVQYQRLPNIFLPSIDEFQSRISLEPKFPKKLIFLHDWKINFSKTGLIEYNSGETFLRPIGRGNWYREIRAPLIEYYANTP